MGTRLSTHRSEPPQPVGEGNWPSGDLPDGPLYGEAPPPGGFSVIVRPLIYVAVGVFCAGALWFAYEHTRSTGPSSAAAVPLIKADQNAAKIRPDQPGGDAVPDQDKLVYNPSQAGSKIENLLPPPEQPLAKPLPPPVTDPLPVQAIAAVAEPKAAPPTPPGAVLPPASASGVLVAPAESGSGKLAPPTPLAPSVAAPIPAVATKPMPAVGAGGPIRVQIAATRDEAAAHAEWQRLQKAHPDLLGAFSSNVVKADLGDKGVFYRVQAGPVPDRDKAVKLCAALKQFSIACIIVKP